MPGEAEVNRALVSPWRSIITPDRWKLNLSAHDQCELFDLTHDPYELVNLYDDSAQQTRVQELTAQIVAWQAAVGDDLSLTPVTRR